MKARVRSTGNIVDVEWYGHDSMGTIYVDVTHTKKYYEYELDFDTVYDYWDRFEHQAAIAAMQGLLQSPHLNVMQEEPLVGMASSIAHALVEKYKEKEK